MILRSNLPSCSNPPASFHPFPGRHREIAETDTMIQGIAVMPKKNLRVRFLRGETVTEIAIEIEIGTGTETGIGTGHKNRLGSTTHSPLAIRLRGVRRRLGELRRRPSSDGPTRYRTRGECTPHHPNILWNTPASPSGNRKPRLLPKLLGGRSRLLIPLQTPTRMESHPSCLCFLPRSPLLLKIRFTNPIRYNRVNRRLHLPRRCRSHNRTRISQRRLRPVLR